MYNIIIELPNVKLYVLYQIQIQTFMSFITPNLSLIYNTKLNVSKKSSINQSMALEQKKTKRKNVILDISEHNNLEGYSELNKRIVKTSSNNYTKNSAYYEKTIRESSYHKNIQSCSTNKSNTNINQHYYMIKEDIMGRLFKRAELIAERQEIQQMIECNDLGSLKEIYNKISYYKHIIAKSKQTLFGYCVQKKHIADKINDLRDEKQENLQKHHLQQRQFQTLKSQEKRRYMEIETKLVQFSQKNNTSKLTAQFLSQYREMISTKREYLRQQFLKFNRNVLPPNKYIELDRVLEELRTSYVRISKQENEKYTRLKQSYRKSKLDIQCLDERITQYEKQLLRIKVNQEIEKSDLSKLKRQEEGYLNENTRNIKAKVEQAFAEYINGEKQSFDFIEKKYGKQTKQKVLQQRKDKFYQIISEDNRNKLLNLDSEARRLEYLNNIIRQNINQVEQVLMPMLQTSYSPKKYQYELNFNKENANDFKNYYKNTQEDKINLEQNQIPIQLRRQAAYEYVDKPERTQYSRNSLERFSNPKKVRLSLDDKGERINKQSFFKIKKKQSLHTEQTENIISECNQIRFTEQNLHHNKIYPALLNSVRQPEIQIFNGIKHLFYQVSIQKKPYLITPAYNVQTSLNQLGYSSRLMSLSLDFNLQFRVGKQPNTKHIMKGGKVDQLIALQRIKKIEKIKSGMSFSICLDKGVVEIVFKVQDQYISWINGLNWLLKNRGISTKLKGKIYFIGV